MVSMAFCNWWLIQSYCTEIWAAAHCRPYRNTGEDAWNQSYFRPRNRMGHPKPYLKHVNETVPRTAPQQTILCPLISMSHLYQIDNLTMKADSWLIQSCQLYEARSYEALTKKIQAKFSNNKPHSSQQQFAFVLDKLCDSGITIIKWRLQLKATKKEAGQKHHNCTTTTTTTTTTEDLIKADRRKIQYPNNVTPAPNKIHMIESLGIISYLNKGVTRM
jgi:hypothetical protein